VADPQATPEAEEQGAWARPVSAHAGEIVVALALLATAGFFVGMSLLLPFGRVGLPGPGFFPFALGIVLAVLALAILVYTLVHGVERTKIVFLGHRDALITFAALIGISTAFEEVDSYLALGIFVIVLLVFIARTTLPRAVIGAVLGMIGVWLFFRLALGVRLPASDYWQDSVNFIVSRFTTGPL
jgi:hypothetical protein